MTNPIFIMLILLSHTFMYLTEWIFNYFLISFEVCDKKKNVCSPLWWEIFLIWPFWLLLCTSILYLSLMTSIWLPVHLLWEITVDNNETICLSNDTRSHLEHYIKLICTLNKHLLSSAKQLIQFDVQTVWVFGRPRKHVLLQTHKISFHDTKHSYILYCIASHCGWHEGRKVTKGAGSRGERGHVPLSLWITVSLHMPL